MRSRFDEQLELLHTSLIEMGAMCETAIANAIKALLSGGQDLAKRAFELHDEIDKKEREIEALCLRLLLQQQPVAKDLRQISSALKMITDMERIGDQAYDIAEIAQLGNIKPEYDTFFIRDMAEAAIHMVTESINAYVNQNLILAANTIKADDTVDDYFNGIKQQLAIHLSQNNPHSEYVIDLLMVAKYLERIGDHAVNIAEWVVFSITGRHEKERE